MSFASSLAAPAYAGAQAARGLLQAPTLRTVARSIGVVAGAGFLAASYQIAYDEGRQIVQNLRVGSSNRRARNMALVLDLMGSDLPLELQDRIRRARDGIDFAMRLLTDEKNRLPDELRIILRQALHNIVGVSRVEV